MTSTLPQTEYVLQDGGEGYEGQNQKIEVLQEGGRLGLAIRPAGTGTQDGAYAPIFIELYEGKWRLIVWDDINEEEASHIIDLSGALESNREPDPPIAAKLLALRHAEWVDKKDSEYVLAVKRVYLYDSNSQTHCCELSRSYYLIYLYDELVTKDAYFDLPEDKQAELTERYERLQDDDPNAYMHCRTVARLVTIKSADHRDLGDHPVDLTDQTYDAHMEDLRERYCANRLL